MNRNDYKYDDWKRMTAMTTMMIPHNNTTNNTNRKRARRNQSRSNVDALFVTSSLLLLVVVCGVALRTATATTVSRNKNSSIFVSAFILPNEGVHVTSRSARRSSSSLFQSINENNSYENPEEEKEERATISSTTTASMSVSRRQLFGTTAQAVLAGVVSPFVPVPAPAQAMLLQFPITPNSRTAADTDYTKKNQLKNKYIFMRAGTSELERDGIYSTNALFLTNRENGLSAPGYHELATRTVPQIQAHPDLQPTLIFHSLAANGMDTGDYLARELNLGRNGLLPEFTYLDQRGIGLWDSSPMEEVKPAMWALDTLEAGKEGFAGKPPPNTDGTANESLHEQFIRLRQFLSLQETRSSGEIILVIFPDGTGPALASCMIAGIPFEDVHMLEYTPGEIHFDITPDSVRESYEQRRNDHEFQTTYQAYIEDGKSKLKELQSTSSSNFNMSYKDTISNERDAQTNNEFYRKQKANDAAKLQLEDERKRVLAEKLQESKAQARDKKLRKEQQDRASKQKKEALIATRKREAEEKKQHADKLKIELYEAKKRNDQEQYTKLKQQQGASAVGSSSSSTSSDFFSSPGGLITGGLGTMGALATAVIMASSDDDDVTADIDHVVNATAATTTASSSPKNDAATVGAAVLEAEEDKAKITTSKLPHHAAPKGYSHGRVSHVSLSSSASSLPHLSTVSPPSSISVSGQEKQPQNKKEDVDDQDHGRAVTDATDEDDDIDTTTTDTVKEELKKLANAEQKMKDALKEVAVNKKEKERTTNTMIQKDNHSHSNHGSSSSSLYGTPPPVTITKSTSHTTATATPHQDNNDEGDWLRLLGEIRDDKYNEDAIETDTDDEEEWTTSMSSTTKKTHIIGAAVFDNEND